MTIKLSGPISLSDCRNELEIGGTVSLTQFNIRQLLNVPVGTISLSNAYGKSKRRPTYVITSDTVTIAEIGNMSTVTFTVNTTDVPDNTLMYWILTEGIGEDKGDSVDFTAMPIGEIRIFDNRATFKLSAIPDNLTEGLELFRVSICTTLGTYLATSQFITITDTSISVPAGPVITPTYNLLASTNSIDEGGTIVFTLMTTNVQDGTLFTYNLVGSISNEDLSPIAGVVVVNNNRALFSVDTLRDMKTEGAESFICKLNLNGELVSVSGSVTLNDASLNAPTATASVQATYSLTASNSTVAEGQAITFTLNTTNVADGTILRYSKLTGTAIIDDFLAGTNPTVTNTNAPVPTVTNAPVNATYTIVPNTYSINENGTVIFTVSTTNIANGTSLNWNVIGNITSTDVNSKTGTVIINNNVGLFNVVTVSDVTTEGTETFSVQLLVNTSIVATSSAVTINDTSIAPTNSPTYTITPNITSVNEGGTVVFTLNTTNIANGTSVTYNIGGTVNTSDISASAGGFAINNNTGTFSIGVNSDLTTEGSENLLARIYIAGALVATSSTVTINDTSTGSSGTTKTYSVSTNLVGVAGSVTINEGQSVKFYVTTTNVPNGTRLYYQSANNSAGLILSDITFTSTTSISPGNNFTINNNAGTFDIMFIADSITEGTESLNITLHDYAEWVAAGSVSGAVRPTLATSEIIYVSDTSTGSTSSNGTTKTYSIATNLPGNLGGVTVTEGSTTTFYVTTTNVANGTRFYFQTANNSAGLNLGDFVSFASSTSIGSGNNFTINNNAGTFTVTLANDSLTEGTESFKVTMHDYAAWVAAGAVAGMQMPILATSETINVSDTSMGAVNATYSMQYQNEPVYGIMGHDEGTYVNFTVTTTNVSDGKRFYYQTLNNSAGLVLSDVTFTSSTSLNSGNNFTVTNNTGTFSIFLTNDSLTEGQESFQVTMHDYAAWVAAGAVAGMQMPILATSSTVKVNDTSRAANTYSISVSPANVNEGNQLFITITSNDTSGDGYSLGATGNIIVEDFTYGPNQGQPAYLTNGTNTNTQMYVANDNLTEGTETFQLQLYKYKTGNTGYTNADILAQSNVVTINDTSVGALPTYSVQVASTTLVEGGLNTTITVITTNVPDGTRFNFSTIENSAGLNIFDIDWYSSTSSGVDGNRQFADFTVTGNYATFIIAALTDFETESTESFKIQITPFGSGQQLAASPTIYITSNNS